MPLAGFEGRNQPFERVAMPLEANSVALGHGTERVLFVALDLLYAGPDITAAIERRALMYGVAPERVIVSASHTHFAPATDLGKPQLGAADAGYLAMVIARLEDLVDQVLQSECISVTIDSAAGVCELNVNRRRRWPWPTLTREGLRLSGTIVSSPSPAGPRDKALDMLRVQAASGRTVALLWKYACHPVSCPEVLAVHPEFPGLVRRRLREAAGDNSLPVVFWQGFSGDTRPNLVGQRSARQWLTIARRGPEFGRVDASTWHLWCEDLARHAVRLLRDGPWRTTGSGLTTSSTRQPLGDFFNERDNPSIVGRHLLWQRVALGHEIELLFASAEPCAPWLRLGTTGLYTLHVGYTGDTFGYLPSEVQVREGGYEGSGYLRYFGLRGGMRHGFEALTDAAVGRLYD